MHQSNKVIFSILSNNDDNKIFIIYFPLKLLVSKIYSNVCNNLTHKKISFK